MRRSVRQLIVDLEEALAEENDGKSVILNDLNRNLVESNKPLYSNTMPHDIIRDALERELDLLQGKFEQVLGRQAARETFARRASALGDGAPDPGMEARETPKPTPEPQLSEAELAEFRAHAAANPWNKRKCTPACHIKAEFERWLGRGLRRAHISALPKTTLGVAYATEVRRYPDRRVEGLIEEPYRLPAGAPRPPSARLMAELSDEERQEQRKRNAEHQRQFRLRHPKNG